KLPEAGDLDKPKLVFFFDEAHMLFSGAPKVLVQKIEQVVKLVRSKGVGIYFVTQSPSDIPDTVLAQLSNRVQHALRAYTPSEQKAVKVAAQSFRANPNFKAEDVIMELGVGEALTSFLDEKGVPTMGQKTSIICPQSLMGPAQETTKQNLMARDGMSKYDQAVDNISAYEVLSDKAQKDAEAERLAAERAQLEKERAEFEAQKAKEEAEAQKQREKEEAAAQKQKEKEEAAAQKQREKEEAAAQKQKEREEAAALKQKEKELEEARKKLEREEEALRKKKEKEAEKKAQESERRKKQIENKLINAGINTGVQVLKRGILNTLFKK
ncbi:MAG: DUF853 family protein, partial [Lachnospiraceae bacterium]|nr:DUF853 family protein [Lachnospiraceae bacterium]